MEPDFVSLVKLALEVDVRMSFRQLVFRGDQVSSEFVDAECRLELIVSGIWGSFAVDFESLGRNVSVSYARAYLVSTDLTEIIQVALLICLLEGTPSIFG